MLRFVFSDNYTKKDVRLYYIRSEFSLYSLHPLHVSHCYHFWINYIEVGLYDEDRGGLAELRGLSPFTGWTSTNISPPRDVLQRDLFLSKRSARKVIRRRDLWLNNPEKTDEAPEIIKPNYFSKDARERWSTHWNAEIGWGCIGALRNGSYNIRTTDQTIVSLSGERKLTSIWFRPIFIDSFDQIDQR